MNQIAISQRENQKPFSEEAIDTFCAVVARSSALWMLEPQREREPHAPTNPDASGLVGLQCSIP